METPTVDVSTLDTTTVVGSSAWDECCPKNNKNSVRIDAADRRRITILFSPSINDCSLAKVWADVSQTLYHYMPVHLTTLGITNDC